jgi:hypothetical protein
MMDRFPDLQVARVGRLSGINIGKKTGPGLSSLISTASATKSGASSSSPIPASVTSKARLSRISPTESGRRPILMPESRPTTKRPSASSSSAA